jgi:hypothetical protein
MKKYLFKKMFGSMSNTIETLESYKFLLLVGPSGVGKVKKIYNL